MFPPEIWNEILLYRCLNSLKDKLKTTFHISFENLCEYLLKTNGIISGFFITACLFDNNQYGDLDIYYQYDIRGENPCKTFNQVFVSDFIPGKYDKTPISINFPDLKYYFPEKTRDESVNSIFKYHRKLQVTEEKSIDLIQTPIDPKIFIKENVSMNFLNTWFDGKKFYFPYNPYQFLFRPFGKILNIGSVQFELYYNPYGHHFRTNPYGPQFHYDDDNDYEHFTGYDDNECPDLIDEIHKFPQKYWKGFQLYSIRSNYIGKENVTNYRLIKTLYRIIKYTSRGIHIKNFNQFFKTRKTYLEVLIGKK